MAQALLLLGPEHGAEALDEAAEFVLAANDRRPLAGVFLALPPDVGPLQVALLLLFAPLRQQLRLAVVRSQAILLALDFRQALLPLPVANLAHYFEPFVAAVGLPDALAVGIGQPGQPSCIFAERSRQPGLRPRVFLMQLP